MESLSQASQVLSIDDAVSFGGAIKSLAEIVNQLPGWSVIPVAMQSHRDLAHLFPNVEMTCIEPRIHYGHRFALASRLREIGCPSLLSRNLLRAVGLLEQMERKRIVRRLTTGLTDTPPALVHSNNNFSPLALDVAQRLGLPSVAHLRGYVSKDVEFCREAPGLSSIRQVISVSDFVADSAVRQGVPREILRVIPDPVDDAGLAGRAREGLKIRQELGIGDAEKVVAIFGRISRLKGHHILVEALGQLCRESPGLRVMIVGDAGDLPGAFLRELKNMAAALGVENRLVWAGYQADVGPYYWASDILAVPTTWHEAFGRVVVEGMLCERPVVASRCGGPQEIISDGETGVLVDKDSSSALAAGIRRLIADPELCVALGRAGADVARRRYSPELVASQTAAVFTEATTGPALDLC